MSRWTFHGRRHGPISQGGGRGGTASIDTLKRRTIWESPSHIFRPDSQICLPIYQQRVRDREPVERPPLACSKYSPHVSSNTSCRGCSSGPRDAFLDPAISFSVDTANTAFAARRTYRRVRDREPVYLSFGSTASPRPGCVFVGFHCSANPAMA